MTTGNEPVQPSPIEQPTPAVVETNAPAPAADPIAAAAQRMVDDPDLIELSAAIEAAKVEEATKTAGAAGDQGEGNKPGEQTPPAAATPDPKTQQQQQPPAVPMIPKPRFDEVNQRLSKAERDAAYWQGMAAARAPATPQPGQQPQPQPQAKPEDRLAAIHAKQDELAAKFDNGEITMADLKREERALTDAEQQVREEVLLAKVPKPAAPQQPQSNELYLETLTANIETEHPMVLAFDKVASDTDWNFVKQRAIENLTSRGIDPTKGDIGKYNLRKEMAVVIDDIGPALVGTRAKAAGIELPNGQPKSQGQQQQQPPVNGGAKARTEKLALAAGAPPNLSLTRASGEDPAAPTDSRIETMSDEEIAALPASVRNKFLGASA